MGGFDAIGYILSALLGILSGLRLHDLHESVEWLHKALSVVFGVIVAAIAASLALTSQFRSEGVEVHAPTFLDRLEEVAIDLLIAGVFFGITWAVVWVIKNLWALSVHSPRASGPAGAPRASGPAGAPRASGPAGAPRASGPAGAPRASGPAGAPRASGSGGCAAGFGSGGCAAGFGSGGCAAGFGSGGCAAGFGSAGAPRASGPAGAPRPSGPAGAPRASGPAAGARIGDLGISFVKLSQQTPVTDAERTNLENLLADLFHVYDIDYKPSRKINSKQINGTFHFSEFAYMVETRWGSAQPTSEDLLGFQAKIDGKPFGTRGVFISMFDYDTNVLEYVGEMVKGARNLLVLVDKHDLSLIFQGSISVRMLSEPRSERLSEKAGYGNRCRSVPCQLRLGPCRSCEQKGRHAGITVATLDLCSGLLGGYTGGHDQPAAWGGGGFKGPGSA